MCLGLSALILDSLVISITVLAMARMNLAMGEAQGIDSFLLGFKRFWPIPSYFCPLQEYRGWAGVLQGHECCPCVTEFKLFEFWRSILLAARYLLRFKNEYTCHLLNVAQHKAFGLQAAKMVIKSLLASWPKHYKGDVPELELYFVGLNNEYGEQTEDELIPGGKDMHATKDNVIAFIHLVANYRLNYQIRIQSLHFLRGFQQLIQKEWIKMFNEHEIQLLISGSLESMDVDDLRSNTHYTGYNHTLREHENAKLGLKVGDKNQEDEAKMPKLERSFSRNYMLLKGCLVACKHVYKQQVGAFTCQEPFVELLPNQPVEWIMTCTLPSCWGWPPSRSPPPPWLPPPPSATVPSAPPQRPRSFGGWSCWHLSPSRRSLAHARPAPAIASVSVDAELKFSCYMIEKMSFLISGEVVELIAKCCAVLEVWEVLETLLLEGLIRHLKSTKLVEKLVEKNQPELLCLLVKHVSDLQSEFLAILKYLLAEAGDTIYASFIGTKQYKDVIADANILQGTMFHEDNADLIDIKRYQSDKKPLQTKQKQLKGSPKPAANRINVFSTYLESGNPMDEQSVEDAFELLHEVVDVYDCFVITTSNNFENRYFSHVH
ncbi:hypothetical protein Cni_G02125 [Canna indica]|uniref:HECT-type E3 ubiquitin transferase n=1 Tax=Canna indica TaxID=4628 RepID=A0AAQ3PZN6_9LILI|nr:hypothetical protein Cni_G02125 [Canna indica]